MSRVVTDPPEGGPRSDGLLSGGWWHDAAETGRIVCDLCPRACSLKAGDRGFCFVRQNLGDEIVLTTFGRSTGFCIDPIEKKPLNHFHPGTSVLSFGTAGCNLGCKFCQNWDISKSREVERLSEVATPEAIAEAARRQGCRSVAFTYNDPVIWAEYAIATARACRAIGIKTVAVTAGYITPVARGPFFEVMDAANVDLKGFTEDFYRRVTYSHLQPVLDTLEWLARESETWFEITNLIIPGTNDSLDDLRAMCRWVVEHCGEVVPVHFTAFHPDFRMMDRPHTPHQTLLQAHEIARAEGLKHVYVGNVADVAHQSTYCPHCGKMVIERDRYALGAYHLIGNRCGHCGGLVGGHFDDRPGTWGRRRLPIEVPRSVSQPPRFSDEQGQAILSAAAEIVAATLLGRPARLAEPTLAGAAMIPVVGAYVTLKRQDRLRACCGCLGATRGLGEALARAARATATEDHRLPPIATTELLELDLSVNLLYGLEPVRALGRDRIGVVQVGRHGLRIRRDDRYGLLLPAVATQNGWDAETFLRQVCRKAGLPTNAWEDPATQLSTFESVELGGPFDSRVLGNVVSTPASTRRPAVAGRFYPAEPDELTRLVDSLLGASERHAAAWSAAMVPHAGLTYSGQLAAAVFNRLKVPDLVLILGPKHTRLGASWAVAPDESWSIPGATIPSDPVLARALADAIPGLELDEAAHRQEHAIEVILPFLARLAPGTRVVGLVVGGGDWTSCQRFARGLAKFIGQLPIRPLLVISSDMNHFANDAETRRLDEIALRSMEKLDPEGLLATVREHGISMCGVLPAVMVMETLRQLGGLRACQRVGHATSADVGGKTDRVVGYAGVVFS